MKILVCALFLWTNWVGAEVIAYRRGPSSYMIQSSRPLRFRIPVRYGPPVKIHKEIPRPSKVQEIRRPSQVQIGGSSGWIPIEGQKRQNLRLQSSYGPPSKLEEFPSSSYGVPERFSQSLPNFKPAQFRQNSGGFVQGLPNLRPAQFNQFAQNSNRYVIPSAMYGVPGTQNLAENVPKDSYGFPIRFTQHLPAFKPANFLNSPQSSGQINKIPSTSYGVPFDQINEQSLPKFNQANFRQPQVNTPPSSSYEGSLPEEAPNNPSKEQFNEFHEENNSKNKSIINSLTIQHLPVFGATNFNQDFRQTINFPGNSFQPNNNRPQIDVRRLPISSPQQSNFEITQVKVLKVDEQSQQSRQSKALPQDKYLPPTTTEQTVVSRPTSPPLITSTTTTTTTTTEAPSVDEEEIPEQHNGTVPNVAIATAFAGRLYLLQTDGSLQRIELTPNHPQHPENPEESNDNTVETPASPVVAIQQEQDFASQPIYQLPNYQTLPLFSLNVPYYTLV